MKLIILLFTTLLSLHDTNSSFCINSSNGRKIIRKNTSSPMTNSWEPVRRGIQVQKGQQRESIRLSKFTQLPKDVEGCVCYFYLSKSDESNKEYIMTEIFAEVAYISIDNKIQKFNLVTFKDKVFYVYTNGIYTLKVEFKNKIKRNDEDFRIKGVLMIYKNKKILIKKNIIGECAC